MPTPDQRDEFAKTHDDYKASYAAARSPQNMEERLQRDAHLAEVSFRAALIAVLRKIDGNLVEVSNSLKASNQNFMERLIPPLKATLDGLTRFLPPPPFVQDGKEFPEAPSISLSNWPPVEAIVRIAKAMDHYITHIKK